jgi:upstream activation factor subunit UAF30
LRKGLPKKLAAKKREYSAGREERIDEGAATGRETRGHRWRQADPAYRSHEEVWDYIKDHDLQDQKNKRMINADDKLQPLFGGRRQVSMFEMTRLVNQHLK